MVHVLLIRIHEKKFVDVHSDVMEFSKLKKNKMKDFDWMMCLVVNWFRLVVQIHVYTEYARIKMKRLFNVYANRDLLVINTNFWKYHFEISI
jgi:hypothetical protein